VVKVDPLGLVNLNLFRPGSSEAARADAYNPKGVFTIAAHSDIWTVFDLRTGKRQLLPSELLDLMKKHGWTEGTPVELLACQTGTGRGYFPDLAIVPYGQVLADESKADVYAPDKFMWWHETSHLPFPWGIYGKTSAGGINWNDPGTLVQFSPR
jgi:hypothetical protein